MAFDGITMHAVIAELNKNIINAKINKVFEPSKNEIILGLYNNGKNYALNINISSNNYRMNLTTHSKPNPFAAPNFCMLLRKHIIGFKIKEFVTYGLERIVEIVLEGYNELNDVVTKKLIIELMGKHSNIILTNSENYIIDSIRHTDKLSGALRDILPAHIYTLPNSDKHDFLVVKSFEEFEKICNGKSIYNSFVGISKNFVSSLNLTDSKERYDYIKSLINNIDKAKLESVINSNKKDYTIVSSEECKNLELNFALDDFYFEKESEEFFINCRNSILKIILEYLKKYNRKLLSINEKLKECKNIDLYKLYGELITSNLYKLPKYNVSKIEVENYYDNDKLITIPLDESISIQKNMEKYFKKYNKLKTALEISAKQKQVTEAELEYIESIVYSLENCSNINEVNEVYDEISNSSLFSDSFKKNTKTKNKIDISEPEEFNIDGFTVLVGKNNKQNDYLSLKLAKPDDLWFHTKDIRGSHVVLRTNGKEISNGLIIKCAKLAASHSKAKNSSNVPVDYCLAKYVKKPSGAKPGMVIYTNYKTVNV